MILSEKIEGKFGVKERGGSNSYLLLTRPTIFGLLAGAMLLVVYLFILSVAQSIGHAWQQFLLLWPWMILLVLGFSVQVGLFVYLRGFKILSKRVEASTKTVVATGTISSASMIACCLHHIVDVLPILGLSAAAAFLGAYQSLFLAIGIASNVVGVTFVLSIIQKHRLFVPGGFLAPIMKINSRKILWSGVMTGAGIVVVVLLNVMAIINLGL